MPVDARKRRKRKKGSKKLKLLVAVVVLTAIGAVVYLNLRKEKPSETFSTVRAERRNLVDKLAETGSIELVRTVEVKSTISGEIRELAVNAGDWVETGQPMAIIEPDPTQSLQLFQKRAAVDQHRISLDELARDFERKKSLFEGKMLAATDFEAAQARLISTRNSLRLAELELAVLETKANLSRTRTAEADTFLDEVRVLAPIAGIVIRRGVEIGEIVMSGISLSGGTVLFEIGDVSQMIVRADIAEIDVAKMVAGLEVDIVVDAYPDTTYSGQVRWLAPVGQKKPGSTIVTFETEIDILDRDPRLRQGMSCDVDIIFSRRDSALSLPLETVEEIFDDVEEGEEVKGRRGRFVAFVAHPAEEDSAASSDSPPPDSTVVDSTALPESDPTPPGDTLVATGSALVAVAAPPDDSTAADSITTERTAVDSAATDSAATDTSAADSVAAEDEGPPKMELERFEEVELQIGLETNTRIEILSGLEESDLVAEDPQLIRRKLEAEAKEPEEGEED